MTRLRYDKHSSALRCRSPSVRSQNVWQYTLVDYPLDGSEGDLGTWCSRLAEDGWQLWGAGIGAVIDHEGREVRRLSVRRDNRIIARNHTRTVT